MKQMIALLCGLLFGIGLALSGMVDPVRVIGFLDITGRWDPSLMLVMGGALALFMPGYWLLVKPRHRSLLGDALPAMPAPRLDGRLIGGAALFGMGWGLVGICPGPALSLLSSGQPLIWLFVAAMVTGSLLVARIWPAS